jgi:hypothetical protein
VGTENDPQVKSRQIRTLEDAGILVYPSNQYAAEAAAWFAKRLQGVE